MQLTLGFSPCPNDTFIFDALVNNKIDTQGISFNILLEDVETLNRLALDNTLDITKLSFGVWPLVIKDYIILNSGSALGTGVGPLVIAKDNIALKDIDQSAIAIPGENTTAHMLFSLAFPQAKNKIFLRYNEIEDYVLDKSSANTVGVIIHENRFTYADKGLQKIIDLGKFWENKTGLPIPLGGIVGKRHLDKNLLIKIDDLIKQSIQYAFGNYPALADYVKINSMEMEESVMRKHIDLYVNAYSLDLGMNGRNAIQQLLSIYRENNPGYLALNDSLFLED
ncbi:MAG: 1,4-dihydroxy-6-naphthoate synthase [Ginsengibacter sp.]